MRPYLFASLRDATGELARVFGNDAQVGHIDGDQVICRLPSTHPRSTALVRVLEAPPCETSPIALALEDRVDAGGSPRAASFSRWWHSSAAEIALPFLFEAGVIVPRLSDLLEAESVAVHLEDAADDRGFCGLDFVLHIGADGITRSVGSRGTGTLR